MQNITPDNLVAFVYADCSSVLKVKISEAAQTQWDVKQKIKALQHAAQQFYTIAPRTPRLQTQQAILQYAAAKQNQMVV